MTSGYGISPLGTYGLNMSGAYSSYDPYMMSMGLGGMNGLTGMTGLGTMSPYAMGSMGMMGMGMYNPTFMSQMMQTQQSMEKSQLQHQADMHALMQQNEVQNLSVHERTIFESAMVNADVDQGIRNLADAVRSGNQDAICMRYDDIKNIIYKKHGEYFRDNSGNMTSTASIDNIITMLYNQKISQLAGEPVDLKTDIKQYGDNAFWHGFHKSFLDKKDYHKRYTEETLKYCFGDKIDNEGGKKRIQKVGAMAGSAAEGLAALGTGAVAGMTLLGTIKGLANSGLIPKALAYAKDGTARKLFSSFKGWGWAAGLALLAGDVVWQMSRDN